MNRTLTITVALVAGLAGGLLTRYIAPTAVHAQNPPIAKEYIAPAAQNPAPKEIRAESFTLVDPQGRPVGTFAFEGNQWGSLGRLIPPTNQKNPRPPSGRIVLRDASGNEIWSAGGPPTLRPLSDNIR